MSKSDKTKVQFRFDPYECIGKVITPDRAYVLEILGFVAEGSVKAAADAIGVADKELYNSYVAARSSIIEKDHPIQNIKLGDIAQPSVMRARNNIIAENFLLMQDYIAAKLQETPNA
jgi:hypothetical protein